MIELVKGLFGANKSDIDQLFVPASWALLQTIQRLFQFADLVGFTGYTIRNRQVVVLLRVPIHFHVNVIEEDTALKHVGTTRLCIFAYKK